MRENIKNTGIDFENLMEIASGFQISRAEL